MKKKVLDRWVTRFLKRLAKEEAKMWKGWLQRWTSTVQEDLMGYRRDLGRTK
jgi:hypothetical protein